MLLQSLLEFIRHFLNYFRNSFVWFCFFFLHYLISLQIPLEFFCQFDFEIRPIHQFLYHSSKAFGMKSAMTLTFLKEIYSAIEFFIFFSNFSGDSIGNFSDIVFGKSRCVCIGNWYFFRKFLYMFFGTVFKRFRHFFF